jgi:hypothetical protein
MAKAEAQPGLDRETLLAQVQAFAKRRYGTLLASGAVLLAAQMSTLSAMINVTGSVVLNDFLKRYLARQFTENETGPAGPSRFAGARSRLAFSLPVSVNGMITWYESKDRCRWCYQPSSLVCLWFCHVLQYRLC